MQQTDFYKLTRLVQERFIGSVNGGGLPAPILANRGGTGEHKKWIGVSLVALVLLVVLFRIGLGDLSSSLAMHGTLVIAAHALLVAVFVMGILRAMATWKATRALPFHPGIYVFPSGLFDARRHLLRIYPLEDLVSAEGPDAAHGFNLAFTGGTKFRFTVKDAERAEQSGAALAAARPQLSEAAEARESVRPKAMAALDPLHGVASPFAPSSPITRRVPFWAAQSPIVAVALGVVIGAAVWFARNRLSDERMFSAASATNDAASYRAYLASGRAHRDEVAQVFLPRAELREAEKAGTVDAIEGYIDSHPNTAISTEVGASLRTAMLAELDKAKQAGTLTALRDFAKAHPNHHLDPELKLATHAVYMAALDNYKKSAPDKDVGATSFVTRLIAFAEQKGPAVEVRFRRRVGPSMEKADAFVGKSKYFNGTTSTPSRYFDPAHAKPREAELGKALVARFAEAFPADVLSFSVGESIADPEAELPPVTVPTLFVEHMAEWAGGGTTSLSPRGVFIGVGFAFEASARLPGDAKPFKPKIPAVWKQPDVAGAKDEPKPEEAIYDAMASDAFDQFAKKLLATFFKPPPKASNK